MGRYYNKVSSAVTTGCLVDRNNGGTESAHEGNHHPYSSIDTTVDSGKGVRALSALLYTHTKWPTKQMKYTNVVTERMGKGHDCGKERVKIRNVRLSCLRSNIGSRGRSRQDNTSLQLFLEIWSGVHGEHRR